VTLRTGARPSACNINGESMTAYVIVELEMIVVEGAA
jgi:hypothetical protein